MKVLAINGSARQNGNTALLINHVFAALQAEGIETELMQLVKGSDLTIDTKGCFA
jgi:multimeric flavodoxin WrbA